MDIYERVYDEPIDKDGQPKENKLLGSFELVDGNMDDYSYDVIVKDIKGELYILHGREVSGFYEPGRGGTRHTLERLRDNYYVLTFLKHNNLLQDKH